MRLEFDFFEGRAKQPDLLATCALEFHFNDFVDDEDNEIRNYTHNVANGVIGFEAGRATCSGYNLVARLTSDHARAVIELLSYFVQKRGKRIEIALYLDEDRISAASRIDLGRVRDRLPGGAGLLISTIGNVEYKHFGTMTERIEIYPSSVKLPHELLDGEAPHPWVALGCDGCFATVKEAAVQLVYCVAIMEAKHREALKLWKAIAHEGQIFVLDRFAVLGLNFNKFRTLGGVDLSLTFQLPRDINCDFSIRRPDGSSMKLNGFLMPNHPGSGVPQHKAFFQITSDAPEYFKDLFAGSKSPKYDSIGCMPHENSFTYTSQLATVKELEKEENARWHGVLLNQVHDVLRTVDITASADPEAKQKADHWLLNWMEWNAEQLQVIEGIRAAKGGMVVVMGPAAIGKTLLQRAIAIYFYSLGFHILSLAPANDNCNKMARDMMLTTDGFPTEVQSLRLFATSRDVDLEEMTDEQRARLRVGHDQGSVLSFSEFLIALHDYDRETELHRQCGVVEAVIKAADEGKLQHFADYKARNGGRLIARLNAWDVLREFIQRYRENNVKWDDDHAMQKYQNMYKVCKGHVIGLNRFMITTTGNARACELMNYWFSEADQYCVPRKGVIVFVDEAARGLEVNVWSGIVCERWAEYVRGVFLFGDDKYVISKAW